MKFENNYYLCESSTSCISFACQRCLSLTVEQADVEVKNDEDDDDDEALYLKRVAKTKV